MPKVNFIKIPFYVFERVTRFCSKVFGWDIEKTVSQNLGFTLYTYEWW